MNGSETLKNTTSPEVECLTQFGDFTVACIHAPLKRINAQTGVKHISDGFPCQAIATEFNSDLDTQFPMLVRYKHSFGLRRVSGRQTAIEHIA